ncbi:MAG: hypothetical protein ABI409_20685, partial [Ramlibacter sp.]
MPPIPPARCLWENERHRRKISGSPARTQALPAIRIAGRPSPLLIPRNSYPKLSRKGKQFMSSPNLHPMLNVAVKAARAAGAIIN